ncbi:hypothetical protein NC653_032653 [Populus alba x Populus x berolinensis]|uniref:Uncharacterized protein n=1 Tax=Populus alba x Populus x berolinensis TaxID=444605 RepID=A0AAD6LRT3_9ROSI|nr:hypothetical protein NC653_032653 [Populus alba x Populus x berolinensis]
MPTVHSDLWKWAVHLCILKIGASHVQIIVTTIYRKYQPRNHNGYVNSLWRSGLHAQHREGFFLDISLLLKQLIVTHHTNGANNTRRATKAKADCILKIPRRVWRLKSNSWQAYRHKLPSQLSTIIFLLRWIIETCHF